MPEPKSEKNLKKIKMCLFIGAIFLTLLLIAAAAAVLFSGRETTWLPRKTMTVLLLCFAPFPIISNLFLMRALNRYSDEAKESATRDALTGLYNQRTFWDLLQYETQRSRRQQYKFSLLHIDVDNFKIINDTYGHEIGDRFLRDFSAILRAAVRKGDIPARFGGDNFTAILPVCDEEQAYVVAHRIMESLRNHSITLPDGAVMQETISIGVAVFPSHAQDARDLFMLADSMLAQAKTSGKDHMAFPSERDNVDMIKNLGETSIMILDAIHSHKRKKIVPYFQPIVSVDDKSVLAYEVLTRIIVDDKIIPAADFIEAAENMGAIGKIDYQLIERAFTIVKERNYPGTLFLNLSPKALVIADFIPTLKALFRDYDIPPASMVFEITERDTVKNVSLIEDFVRKLKDEGFRFAIDDFGAGYSSFHYLKTFDVDFLKVDGEFIRTLHGGGSIEKEIVTSIAALANRLKIKTIAEYVESEGILDQVRTAGIHYAQGYYIKRPSPDLI
ncbi:MAG: bifunctional diguanylate cyclase/phosphodiesterase [Nitrospirota bacterium]|nr:bifunctional diguanylate cyclase/phosphodiesterase [Nitrospirota bacterium]